MRLLVLFALSAFGMVCAAQSSYPVTCQSQLQCNCENQLNTLTIDGKAYPNSCACGYQTRNGEFTITSERDSMGTYLAKGTPMLNTQPEICSACFIHTGSTTQGTLGIGCLHLPQDLFSQLLSQCQNQNMKVIITGAVGGTANSITDAMDKTQLAPAPGSDLYGVPGSIFNIFNPRYRPEQWQQVPGDVSQ